MKKLIQVYSLPILIAPALTAFFTTWPPSASARGIAAIIANWIGIGLAIALIGSIGLLYRPNRLAGLSFGIILASLLWLAGVSESSAQNPCLKIPIGVAVCAPKGEWTARPNIGNSTYQFESKGEWFGQLVIDEAGRNKDVTASAAAELIKDNLTRNGATILVDGQSGNRDNRILVYSVNAKGIPMIFANTIKIGNSHTLQIVTFRIAQNLDVSDREAHLRFGKTIFIPADF